MLSKTKSRINVLKDTAVVELTLPYSGSVLSGVVDYKEGKTDEEMKVDLLISIIDEIKSVQSHLEYEVWFQKISK